MRLFVTVAALCLVLIRPGLASADVISLAFTTTLDFASMTFPGDPDWLTPAGIVPGAPVEGTLTINTDALKGVLSCPIYCSYYQGDFATFTMQIGSVTLSAGAAGSGGTFFGSGPFANTLQIEFFSGVTGGVGPVGDLWFFFSVDPSFSGLSTLEPDMLSDFHFHTAGERFIEIGADNIDFHAVPEPGVLPLLSLGLGLGFLRTARARVWKR
jgi:hypothetical protein